MVQVAKTKKQKRNFEVKASKVDDIFTLVKGENNVVRIAVGNNVVSAKQFKNFTNADNYIANKPYELLVNLICVISQNIIKNEKEQKNTETKKDA